MSPELIIAQQLAAEIRERTETLHLVLASVTDYATIRGIWRTLLPVEGHVSELTHAAGERLMRLPAPPLPATWEPRAVTRPKAS